MRPQIYIDKDIRATYSISFQYFSHTQKKGCPNETMSNFKKTETRVI